MILVHGGEVFGRMRDTITQDIICYEKKTKRWKKLPYYNDADNNSTLNRMGHSLVCVNNSLFVIGGMTCQNKDPSSVVVEISIAK